MKRLLIVLAILVTSVPSKANEVLKIHLKLPRRLRQATSGNLTSEWFREMFPEDIREKIAEKAKRFPRLCEHIKYAVKLRRINCRMKDGDVISLTGSLMGNDQAVREAVGDGKVVGGIYSHALTRPHDENRNPVPDLRKFSVRIESEKLAIAWNSQTLAGDLKYSDDWYGYRMANLTMIRLLYEIVSWPKVH